MHAFRRFAHAVTEVVKVDAALFRRFPKLTLAALGILFVPAIYALIYLGSVWEPNARTTALPVGVVNDDAGVHYRDQDVNVGKEIVAALGKQPLFGYRSYPDAEAARAAVRNGTLYFALLIPKDFSSNAVPGAQQGGAKLVIYTSEGNNYAGAGFAKRFAPEIAHRVNEALNEKRWELVLATAAGSQQSLGKLKSGITELKNGADALNKGMADAHKGSTDLEHGAAKLRAGAQQVNAGTAQLTDGVKQLGAGLRTMDAKKPAQADLQALADGAHTLATGEAELGKGLAQLHAGSKRLTDGARQMKEQTAGIPLVGGKVSKGAAQLEAGVAQLTAGLGDARNGQARLADGARRLDDGVSRLTSGLTQLNDGIHTAATKMPEDAKLDALATGTKQLADGSAALDDGAAALAKGMGQLQDGSARLAAGLALVDASLPAGVGGLDGSATGLAGSVQPDIEIAAPVANNGSGFAPNFVPVALWVGAVMTTFIFYFRRLPELLRHTPRFAQVLGKLVVPGVMVLAQALIMLLMLRLLLDVRVPDLFTFGITLAVASLTFLAILLALIRLIGDAGKAVAVIFLIIQLSSAGALIPIELTSGFYQTLHPFLPITWVVRAFRASLFGAFDGAWLPALGVVAAQGVLALLIATWLGKWKFIDTAHYGPAIDL